MISVTKLTDEKISADLPLNDPKEDLFRRYPFAQRIAESIGARDPSSPLVIGIYGPWGDGKTSVLNFVRHELEKMEDVITVSFNPWQFNNENALLMSFFSTLAEALNRDLKSKKEKIGDILSEYGQLLAPLSYTGATLGINPGVAAEELGKKLSNIPIQEKKKKIETLLAEEKKRIVILIDDIDRLDKQEIHALFRLVKLTADFSYCAYVLAFDPEIVASSIGERYGGNIDGSGMAFLEKIIQVPLNLPHADTNSLLKVALKGVDEVCNRLGITLGDNEAQGFVRHFFVGFSGRLKTPRIAKRYVNAITFALPIMATETKPTDLMLTEGLRVFWPDLYLYMKRNRDNFTGRVFDRSFTKENNEFKKRILTEIHSTLKSATIDEKKGVEDLIEHLFPRTVTLFRNNYSPGDEQSEWREQKRIAHSDYFDRYFSYTVPAGDISDGLVDEIISLTNVGDSAAIQKKLLETVNSENADKFISKVWDRSKSLSDDSRVALVTTFAKNGSIFPNQNGSFFIGSPHRRAAMLMAEIMCGVKNRKLAVGLAKSVMSDGNPLDFLVEGSRWLRSQNLEKRGLSFTKRENDQITKSLSDRIKKESSSSNLFEAHPSAAASLLDVWAFWGNEHQPLKYLRSLIKNDLKILPKILRAFATKSYSLDTGIPLFQAFEAENYKRLTKLISGEELMIAAKKYLGAKEFSKIKEYQETKTGDDNEVVRQFVFLHNKFLAPK